MKRLRNPDTTRLTLLQAAFEEIHHYGFQAASLSRILANTNLTKGALYHHFPDKNALGYAVLDEIIQNMMLECWVHPLQDGRDPVTALIQTILKAGGEFSEEDIYLGCPLNNLAQEMSPVDEGFRSRISHIYHLWQQGISQALTAGQKSGAVRQDIDTESAAVFIVASLEGCIGMAKNARDSKLLYACGKGVIQYLETLRT